MEKKDFREAAWVFPLNFEDFFLPSQNAPQHTTTPSCFCKFGDYGAESRTDLGWQGASASSGIILSLLGTEQAERSLRRMALYFL